MTRMLSLPFVMAWGLISFIFSAIGRLFALGMGAALAGLGVLLCMSLVGIMLGAPMTAFGTALMVRAIV